jgi:3-carboxy-cis,cis-muconate cycloisomerase
VTFEAIFVPAPFREAVDDRAWVAAMLESERALANAGSLAGLVPAHLAGPIADACEVERFDVAAIVEAGRSAGNPAEPLVRALRDAVGVEAAGFVHYGATSQDIVDTAAMLVARRVLALVEEELDGVSAACAGLAEAHRTTPMAARTLLQQAVPTTFGLKAAGWLLPVVRARGRLAELRERLPAELGGAAGTLAALGDEGLRVAGLFADELDLVDPVLPWHTDRAPVADLGAALTVAAGACAKIALDVALLEQTEVGEVGEPAGAGGSSTMPHKRNPVGSALALASWRRVLAAAGTLTAGLVAEHERSLGAWQAEWGALSEALAFAGGAASAVRGVVEGLSVNEKRMRANLEATQGGVSSERVLFALAPKVGRERANELVTAGLGSGSLREALAGELSPEELDELLDPAGYLGSAPELVDRALALYREDL